MNERKITVRNVDKIKELKKKLAEAERYAARRPCARDRTSS